jgi:hypothetical protein
MTPEGIVKKTVKEALAAFATEVDGFWPVPSGYGESHLDYVGCMRGWFFAIETKKPGGKVTPRQKARIQQVKLAGGKVFVIDGTDKTDTITDLFAWLNTRPEYKQ